VKIASVSEKDSAIIFREKIAIYPEDGGSDFFRIVSKHLSDHTS
jgi:hypothetical protein